MYRNTIQKMIDCPIEEVFAYLTDVGKQPEWTHFLVACTLTGEEPIGLGSVAVQTIKMMGKTQEIELYVVEFEKNRRVRFEKHEPFYITFGFELEAKAHRTQVVYSVEMKPTGLFGLFIPLIAHKENERDMANIKNRVETGFSTNLV